MSEFMFHTDTDTSSRSLDPAAQARRDLLHAIITQALHDYTFYNICDNRVGAEQTASEEALETASWLFFRPEFEFEHLRTDDEEQPLTLSTLCGELLNIPPESVNLSKIKKYLLDQTRSYWSEKILRVIKLPSQYISNAVVYHVVEDPNVSEVKINYETKQLLANPIDESEDYQKKLLYAFIKIETYEREMSFSETQCKDIAELLYQMFKFNFLTIFNITKKHRRLIKNE